MLDRESSHLGPVWGRSLESLTTVSWIRVRICEAETTGFARDRTNRVSGLYFVSPRKRQTRSSVSPPSRFSVGLYRLARFSKDSRNPYTDGWSNGKLVDSGNTE